MIYSKPIIEAIGWTVIHSLWQGAAIAIVLSILFVLFKKLTANSRYVLGTMALFFQVVVSIFTFDKFYIVEAKANPLASLSTDPVFLSNIDINTSFVENTAFIINQYMDYIVLIWGLGIILFSFRLLIGYTHIFYLRNRYLNPIGEKICNRVATLSFKLNIKKNILIFESELIQSPIVTGWIKPIILFPIGLINQLNSAEIEAILAHEIAHIRRNDFFFNLLQSLVEILFYYHPGIWWISNQIRQEREHCCDDIAMSITGNRMDYAKALLQVQNYAHTPQFTLGFSGNKGHLLTRVQRILKHQETKNRRMGKMVVSLLILTSLFMLSFSEYKASTLDSLFEENTTIITLKTDKNNDTSLIIDTLPMGKTHLKVHNKILKPLVLNNTSINTIEPIDLSSELNIEELGDIDIEIDDNEIVNLLLNGEVIPKNKLHLFQSKANQYLQESDQPVNIFVVNQDTVIVNGEDVIVVENENRPIITIKKTNKGAPDISIEIGKDQYHIVDSDEDNYSAYIIEKEASIDDIPAKYKKKTVPIKSIGHMADTTNSYFVDKIYELNDSWMFHDIKGTIQTILKTQLPKVIVKTVDNNGSITNRVTLYHSDGGYKSTYYSLNEISTDENIKINIDEISNELEDLQPEIEALVLKYNLKSIHK